MHVAFMVLLFVGSPPCKMDSLRVFVGWDMHNNERRVSNVYTTHLKAKSSFVQMSNIKPRLHENNFL